MAAYGSGYYGGGNYSYGVSLGAVAFQGTSTATAAGVRFTFGAFEVTSTSDVVINGTRIAFMSASVASDSVISIDSNVIVNQAVTVLAESSVAASGIRVRPSVVPFVCASQMVVAGRLKWETEPDTSETWTPIADTSETWTRI
jgi:hypothetical protein